MDAIAGLPARDRECSKPAVPPFPPCYTPHLRAEYPCVRCPAVGVLVGKLPMVSTREWAAAHGVCVDDRVPSVDIDGQETSRPPRDIAIRTLILHCVAAVGYGVDPQMVIEWLQDQALWEHVSPQEQAFLHAGNRSPQVCRAAQWRQEAEWTLLWCLGRVESLGLPTHTCDTARLVNEIMPAPGDPVDAFVSSATLRPPEELLGEEDRTYNLHCYARQAYSAGNMPADLMYDVLFQRHYAFEWLGGEDDWDDVQTDT